MAVSAERLFIGVPVPPETQAALATVLPKNLPGKLVAIDKWHFTLRFLGSTSTEARDLVVAHLVSANLGPAFTLQFGELGAFPTPRRARILWVGVTHGGERLSALARKAEDAARAAGFAPETKEFTPHLTLSRLVPPQNITPLMAARRRYEIETRVGALILYRSRLGGGPARYEEVERFPL